MGSGSPGRFEWVVIRGMGGRNDETTLPLYTTKILFNLLFEHPPPPPDHSISIRWIVCSFLYVHILDIHILDVDQD